MAGKFQIKRARNGKYFFNLLAKNGEPILTSQMYASKATARKGIASVQANAADSAQFEARTNKAGQHYFVLKARNHQIIGNGEAYSGSAALRKGITSVGKNAPGAGIEDLT
ncbi:MAG: YegP family protein [Planctomycetaceae bacterium]|nr:YegP family protein [Planctomycetaceae bacterium]